MSNLGALLKVNLKENLDFRKFKENKGKSTGFLIVITLAILGGFALSSFYSYYFGSMLNEAGLSFSMLIAIMLGLSSMICFSTVVFKTKSIFTSKDYETLSAMPIKKGEIIFSKIIGLYLVELIYSAIVMLPAGVVSTIFSSNPLFLLEGFIGAILVPAVPIAVGSLFALLVAFVADRFKFGNVITIVLYFALLVGVFFISYSISTSSNESGVDATAFQNLIGVISWINPVNRIYLLCYSDNYAFLALYIGVNVATLALAVLFIALAFKPVYELVNNLSGGNKYVRKALKVEGQGKALFKNEFKRYFKSKMYIMNTLASGVMCILVSIVTPLMIISEVKNQVGPEVLEEFSNYAYFGVALIIFMIGIETPATCGISIEGANFWAIKTLPINYKTYCKNKIYMSTIVLGVCSLISSVAIGIILKASLLSWILLIILPLGYVFLVSSMGLYINLYYYKLKWKNEQECVKNSAGIVIAMIIDLLLSIALSVVLVGFPMWFGSLGEILGICITSGVIVISAIVFFALVVNNCERRIKAIEEF